MAYGWSPENGNLAQPLLLTGAVQIPLDQTTRGGEGPVTAPVRRRETFLPYAPPLIGEEEIAEVVDTLRSGWITTGPKTARFESEFAAALGAPGALALSSCTTALHLALAANDIGPGAEVITSTLTFSASANVIEHCGARPVLVDVEPDTLNLSPAAVEAAITPRTRAIEVVHYAGHPVDLDAFRALAAARNLLLVEDAAHAVASWYKGKRIGSSSNPVAFSFYPTKNMTTGEGGMLTGEAPFLDRARQLSLHGMSRNARSRYERGGSWYYEVTAPGFKYNMSDLQSAIGLWQLRKLDGFQKRRRVIIESYTEALGGLDAIEVPVERKDVVHGWHMYVIRLRPGTLTIDRDRFITELTTRNIGTSVHFIPVHTHPFYRDRYGYRPEDFPVAWDSYQRMISLPISARHSDQDIADVIEAVRDVAFRYGK